MCTSVEGGKQKREKREEMDEEKTCEKGYRPDRRGGKGGARQEDTTKLRESLTDKEKQTREMADNIQSHTRK